MFFKNFLIFTKTSVKWPLNVIKFLSFTTVNGQ